MITSEFSNLILKTICSGFESQSTTKKKDWMKNKKIRTNACNLTRERPTLAQITKNFCEFETLNAIRNELQFRAQRVVDHAFFFSFVTLLSIASPCNWRKRNTSMKSIWTQEKSTRVF